MRHVLVVEDDGEGGNHGFLAKPFRRDDLVDII
jgi:hypothetical protein